MDPKSTVESQNLKVATPNLPRLPLHGNSLPAATRCHPEERHSTKNPNDPVSQLQERATLINRGAKFQNTRSRRFHLHSERKRRRFFQQKDHSIQFPFTGTPSQREP